ncbi:hypothetical protein KKC44_01745 [Patescibacteria group bacterium]|nr:hypothetical protein [Patescibacteria group bacterium]MBU2259305.1 hypothetical protein [Patescibacteria group bacterium]
MKPLLQGLSAGVVVAIIHVLILTEGWALWDVSIISISALSTGVFFIMGMIFQSTIQDYKKGDIAIAQLGGNLLSMYDLSTIAIQEQPTCDAVPFRRSLFHATEMLTRFVRNDAPLETTDSAVAALIPMSLPLRKALPGAQANLFLKQHQDVRQAISYLAFLKKHNFPAVGYVFLWFFVSFIIVLQLFSQTQNRLLDSLFLFSLTSIFFFFIQFIRDLEHPFLCSLACFTLDVRPLEHAASVLRKYPESPPRSLDPLFPFPGLVPLSALQRKKHRIPIKVAFR